MNNYCLTTHVYIYIYHHHHHVVLVAQISLTLTRHSSLSFIALGRSSGQHPVVEFFFCPIVCVCVYIYIYIYIYIVLFLSNCICVCVCVCIYIYIYTHTHIYTIGQKKNSTIFYYCKKFQWLRHTKEVIKKVIQKVPSFTKILDLLYTCQLWIGLTSTKIKMEIWISFSNLINDSV